MLLLHMQEIVPVDFRRAFCPLEGGGGPRHTGTRLTTLIFYVQQQHAVSHADLNGDYSTENNFHLFFN